MRRRIVATAVGVLLCLPMAAFAQESEPAETGVGSASAVERQPAQEPEASEQPTDETGIGEPDAVECRGTVTATVVDLDGAPVSGAMLSVAGEQFAGSGSVESLCGEVAASGIVGGGEGDDDEGRSPRSRTQHPEDPSPAAYPGRVDGSQHDHRVGRGGGLIRGKLHRRHSQSLGQSVGVPAGGAVLGGVDDGGAAHTDECVRTRRQVSRSRRPRRGPSSAGAGS